MSDNESLSDKLGDLVHRRPWYTLPRLLAMPRLIQIRNELRAKNLHDTEEPPLERNDAPDAVDPSVRSGRTIEGSYNDLSFPRMGAANARFGRNVALEHTRPDTANLLNPNPRTISLELMTRTTFKEVPFLNLLAASWIQFMVHDWFVHKTSKTDAIEIPLAEDDAFPVRPLQALKTIPATAPAGSTRPPAYENENSHWWDASQIYGCDSVTARKVRTFRDGKLRIQDDGRLFFDPETGGDLTGFNQNWWIGLSMLHALFVREHNAICDKLKTEHATWTDEDLFQKARLINSALMAKIHTVEWTPAILPHDVIKIAMKANWSGLVDQELQDALKLINENEILGGITGSHAEHHTAPYSLTEEFVAVYRMHPLMPDDLEFRSLETGEVIEQLTLPEVAGRATRPVLERLSMTDLFYSFGRMHPGQITLRNYPRSLQLLKRDDGTVLDLASIDILRDRERGVPRYNEFRRLIHKEPVKTFEELTNDAALAADIKRVYNGDLEKVDLMVGLYAEPLPEHFGFSDTAFRIFILMASRRLKSDRFFTDDFQPEMYTTIGRDWIRENGMASVLRRHLPELAPAFEGLENPFEPWKTVAVKPLTKTAG